MKSSSTNFGQMNVDELWRSHQLQRQRVNEAIDKVRQERNRARLLAKQPNSSGRAQGYADAFAECLRIIQGCGL